MTDFFEQQVAAGYMMPFLICPLDPALPSAFLPVGMIPTDLKYTWADLERYTFGVASAVGGWMSQLFGIDNAEQLERAHALGHAMQLTNIARDVVEDAKMGRRYLPGDWVNHLSPEDIVLASKNPTSHEGTLITLAVERLLDLAETYYASGRAGLSYLPFRAHFSIGVAAKVYRQIGRQLLKSKDSWHGRRQVTSKTSKMFCTVRSSPATTGSMGTPASW